LTLADDAMWRSLERLMTDTNTASGKGLQRVLQC
jgi:hypothetical protein